MHEREYLISLGLAKPGRGRLSRDAHNALDEARAEGMVFTNNKIVKDTVVRDEDGRVVFKPSVHVRKLTTSLYGYTEEGWKVGFSTCRRCSQYMNYCECPQGICPPSIVVSLDERTQKAVEYPHGK